MRSLLASLAAPCVLLAAARAQDNVLVIVADDLGVDMVERYGEGPDPAKTPTIDSLAANGVLFRNAWANPVCSPTRAHLQTGRYGFRTGLGVVVGKFGWGLQLGEQTLPEALAQDTTLDYSTAFIGKWHLSSLNTGWIHGPLLQGYDHFVGTTGNFKHPQDYFTWDKVDNGSVSVCTEYATTNTVDEALAWIATAQEPWMCFVAFNAPHAPFHAPPANLHTQILPNVDPRYFPRPFYKAMIEALDTEMERMLHGMSDKLPRTNVIFIGDNGTPQECSLAPFVGEHAKLTPYEGGVNVPLIVSGPAVRQPGREVTHLVGAVDVFDTVLELVGAHGLVVTPASIARDSVSFASYLGDPSAPRRRRFIYADHFNPNGPPGMAGASFFQRTIRDEGYKLILFDNSGTLRTEFYDLRSDPFETSDIMAQGLWSVPRLTALTTLASELSRLSR
jgi:arylsulfatase A-like enzyme